MSDIQTWNTAAAELGLGLYWRSDDNQSHAPEINEISDIAGFYKTPAGTAMPAFQDAVHLVEQLLTDTNPKVMTDTQRALLKKEATFRTPSAHTTYLDSSHFPLNERRMALHILRAIRNLEEAYLWQVDPDNAHHKIAVENQKDAVAQRHFVANHGPHCMRVKETECSALPSRPTIVPGAHLYLTGLTPEDFRKLPEKLRSPYVALAKKGAAIIPVPFAAHMVVQPALHSAAMELSEAAQFAHVDKKTSKAEKAGMAAFQTYLLEVSKALLSTQVAKPFHKAHQAWAKIPADFRWALQFGPMEVMGGDRIRGHYGYQAYFGTTSVADGTPMGAIERYGIQRMENEWAALVGQPPRTLSGDAVNRIRVVQPMMVDGNARPPFGSYGGFAGPNDEVKRLSWVIMNENAESLRRINASVTTHFGAQRAKAIEIGFATFNTALHEQGHKLGTQRPDNSEKSWSILEECKASIAPFWFAQKMQRANVFSDERRDGLATTQLSWVLFFLNQPLKSGEEWNTYPAVATMIFGHLVEKGALRWDDKAQIWDVTLSEVSGALEDLLKDIMTAQTAGDKRGAETLIQKYVRDPKVLALRDQIGTRSKAVGMPPPMTYVYAVGMDD